jgi:drug/metabolite transporter (DMT)-like permease
MSILLARKDGNKNKTRVGYSLIILCAVLTAMTHVLAKPLLDEHINIEINPVLFAACIYMINAAFFTPLTKKSARLSSLGSRNYLLLGAIGVLEAVALITYFFGLKGSTATNAAIISNSEIIFPLIIATVLFRENVRKKEMLPYSLIIFGMLILPITYDMYLHNFMLNDLMKSDMLIIASGVLYGTNIILCRYLGDSVDSKRIMQIISCVSGALAIGAIIVLNIPISFEVEDLGKIALYAIAGIGMSSILFIVALRILGGSRTVILYSTNSAFGVLFSGIFLSEQITMISWISISLTFAGIYILKNKIGSRL